jgi:competence protein ComEC
LAVLVGSALQMTQEVLWPPQNYLVIFVLALGMLAVLRLRVLAAASTLGWFLACTGLVFALTGGRANVFDAHRLAPTLEGKDILLTGVIAAMPQHNDVALRFLFDVESATLNGLNVELPNRLELSWYSGVFARGDGPGELTGELQRVPVPLVAGERWQLMVRLKAPHGNVNPHGFDFELSQWERGVQATGYVRAGPKDPVPQRLSQTGWHPVEWARGEVRDRIFEGIEDRQAAGLTAALVVGDQRAIDRADWDVFRATGVAHLMSISGLHVTMFAWGAALLVGWLWRRSGALCMKLSAPSAGLLGGLLLAGLYALFSGWGVPAQRTVLMLATVGVLRLSGLRWPWPQVWLLACAVVLLADPWACFQAGFWLSFVAVGVLFATDVAAHSSQVRSRYAALLAMLREQWVITLALTPLTLLLFGQVSLVGLLANAVAIPWVTLVVTPLAMAGTFLPSVWQLSQWATSLLMALLTWFASWPWATLAVAQAPAWAGAVGVVGGLMLAMRLPASWRLAGLPLLMPVLLWQAPLPPVGHFEVLAADVGQGNAVLVRTAHHALLYDAGPMYSQESDAGHRVLVPLLKALDVRLNMLVLSHRDTDHSGGAFAVLAMQPDATLLSSVGAQHALNAVRPVEPCVAGQRWQWDGVDFEILHPLADDYADKHKTNAMSCTLRVANASQAALLTGDIEQPQEARLVASGARLRSQWLLVPHHGSKTSSSPDFLDAVLPRFAMVQAGYRNRFGHPASPVLVRYDERQIAVIDTPHCGASRWQSWQADEIACERELQRRYWRHRAP